ncbi:hypothetical protein [uncultured Litoreibacter sp.]|uniref:hypothetical protein n=1 Tax=uncultured Litoreibacter sp. TaxID=1392394 RepID=UPI002613EC60|nr:hypothetical protein [uncultured Litoreibacter sp.]
MIGTLCAIITASTVANGFEPTTDLFAVTGPRSQFGFANQATCRISLCEDSFGNGPREAIDFSTDSCSITGSNFGHSNALQVRTTYPDQPSTLLSALAAAPDNSFTLYGGGAGQITFVLKTENLQGAFFTGANSTAGMVMLNSADIKLVKNPIRRLGLPLPSITAIVADANTIVISDAGTAYAFDVSSGVELGRVTGSFGGTTGDEIGLAGVLCSLRVVHSGGVARLLVDVYATFPNLKRMDDDCEP